MEGAEKSKKVKKEKRSVKKTKAVAVSATAEAPAAPIAEPPPVAKLKSKEKSTEKKTVPLDTVQEPTL
jgi:hypothetical protein